jgi:hypothetical protein
MHKLQECTTIQEASKFLRGKSPTFKKTVETAILLRRHPDPQQQALGETFMQTAIQELDDSEKPAEHNDDGLKTKGEHFVKEEELAGGNPSGTEGSEQSSKNSEPVTSKEGTTEPEGDMESPGMSTENQFSETFPPMPGMQPPGMDPNLAQQMAPQMPQIPPMNTPQQIQQMQYTVKKYMEAYVKPIREQVIKLTKANSFLSNKVREMQTSSVGLDITKFSKENRVPRLQETTMPSVVSNVDPKQTPRIYEKAYNLEKERQSITDIDKLIASTGNQPYQ